MTKIVAEFDVQDPEAFQEALRAAFGQDDNVRTFTAGAGDDTAPVRQRSVLREFAFQMEAKLLKNDHKVGWQLLPVEALFRQMMLEVEEFRVAQEFLPVREARNELVDVANFCLILWDRLSREPQNVVVAKK